MFDEWRLCILYLEGEQNFQTIMKLGLGYLIP